MRAERKKLKDKDFDAALTLALAADDSGRRAAGDIQKCVEYGEKVLPTCWPRRWAARIT